MPETCRPALLLGLALALTACGGHRPEPVAIAWNEDLCSHCRMAISDPGFAAEIVLPDGRFELFDDPGCLDARIRAHDLEKGASVFVGDYRDRTWLDARAAVYVESPKLPTPMGPGLAAFRERAAAEALAAELGGRVLGWDELRREDRQ